MEEDGLTGVALFAEIFSTYRLLLPPFLRTFRNFYRGCLFIRIVFFCVFSKATLSLLETFPPYLDLQFYCLLFFSYKTYALSRNLWGIN